MDSSLHCAKRTSNGDPKDVLNRIKSIPHWTYVVCDAVVEVDQDLLLVEINPCDPADVSFSASVRIL
jgi:hypothetical protein